MEVKGISSRCNISVPSRQTTNYSVMSLYFSTIPALETIPYTSDTVTYHVCNLH